MGFDLYGNNKDRDGQQLYFRASVWSWRPLWALVKEHSGGALTPELFEAGQYNDGKLIPVTRALRIARHLRSALASGAIRLALDEMYRILSSLPKVPCECCAGTGKRLPPPVCGAGDQPCNGCGATGKRDDYATYYRVELDHFVDFVDFCEASGGFRIH